MIYLLSEVMAAGQQTLGIASSSSDLDAGMEGYLPSHSHDSNDGGDRARSGSDAAGGHVVKRGGGLFGMISSVVGGGRKDEKGSLQRLLRDVTWPSFTDRGVLPPTAFQNERFKLIPNIPEGPWVVKSAVGKHQSQFYSLFILLTFTIVRRHCIHVCVDVQGVPHVC